MSSGEVMLRIKLLAPHRFRPANDSLPVAVPVPGEYARSNDRPRGLVSGWVADMAVEVRRLEVFGR